MSADANCRDTIANALTAAHHALTITHGLTATDRPDLSTGAETTWILDHTVECTQLDAALVTLTGGTAWPLTNSQPTLNPSQSESSSAPVGPAAWAADLEAAADQLRYGLVQHTASDPATCPDCARADRLTAMARAIDKVPASEWTAAADYLARTAAWRREMATKHGEAGYPEHAVAHTEAAATLDAKIAVYRLLAAGPAAPPPGGTGA